MARRRVAINPDYRPTDAEALGVHGVKAVLMPGASRNSDHGLHYLGGMLDRKSNRVGCFLERELVREERLDRVAVPQDQLGRLRTLVSLTAADAVHVQLAKRESTDA